jgi:small conductance mechanosensitive channel
MVGVRGELGRNRPFRRTFFNYHRWLTLEVVLLIVGILLILATLDISRRNIFPFITSQIDYIISAEAAIVGILLIENIGQIIVNRFHERGIRAYGIYFRTVVRIFGYLVVVAAVISILGANPTLAISIGTITGVFIGFASQNVTANVLAAGLLVATRIIRVGDTITVAGNTGQVVDLTLLYTVVETETGKVFVPNSMMVTTAVQRRAAKLEKP